MEKKLCALIASAGELSISQCTANFLIFPKCRRKGTKQNKIKQKNLLPHCFLIQ